jgi:hypothetical protein
MKRHRRRLTKLATLLATTSALTLLLGLGTASASKEVIAYFGTEVGTGSLGGEFWAVGDVAVNSSGAGPGEAGDVYAIDLLNRRIQRFGLDDGGTPADPYDDKYEFVSAWGADVDSTPSGGSDYEICAIAAECKAGVSSTGNGTVAGNGTMANPEELAVDQDTGQVYLAGNNRVNVYSGDGTFLRAFGFDVVASGPGEAGTGYEICVAANGDVCKQGTSGSGAGQIGIVGGVAISQPDGNPTGGTVFLADQANHRVNTYSLDGSSPSSFGSEADFGSDGPMHVAIDSRGIVYAEAGNQPERWTVARYDSQNANGGGVGFLAPILVAISERQSLSVSASAGKFKLTFGADTTPDLPFDATAVTLDSALESLPSIGPSNVAVTGGPGGLPGSSYQIEFTGALGAQNVQQLVVSPGSPPLTGGSGASVQTSREGQAGPLLTQGGNQVNAGLEVDLDSDGAGPDADVLYALRGLVGFSSSSVVQQLGPLNPPGLSAPPTAVDDTHGSVAGFNGVRGFGLDDSRGRLFISTGTSVGGAQPKTGIYVLDKAGGPPSASIDSVSDITATTATINGTINPNGPPPVSYRIEYSLDGSAWSKGPEVTLGTQETPQEVHPVLDPPGTGLEPSTLYHVRLVATKVFNPPVVTAETTFTTLPAGPDVETTGSPVRTATTARLEGRLNPRKSPTSYHFEYGDQGPCDLNPCQSTPLEPAGSGNRLVLVSAEVSGLQPGATYHYRLMADNGIAGVGEDMTLTTRASDAPLSHGHFPGPPGSDRAWEQVNVPDTGGNPTNGAVALSDDGNRASYQIFGGTPLTETGSLLSQFFAVRTASGWKPAGGFPLRDEMIGYGWTPAEGMRDLSSIVTANVSSTEEFALWRLGPGIAPVKLFEPAPSSLSFGGHFWAATEAPVTVAALGAQLYDVSSGTPVLASALPDGSTPACSIELSIETHTYSMGDKRRDAERWLTPDGRLLFFPSRGNDCTSVPRLYVRDLVAQETKTISPEPVSGLRCGDDFIKSTSGAVFFWSRSRLVAEDTAPPNCASPGDYNPDGDVYRYQLSSGELECVTCVVADLDADVRLAEHSPESAAVEIAVAEDGSRVYFQSPNQLLPGAAPNGTYRVNVATGDLRWVGSLGQNVLTGNFATDGNAINPNGSVLIFRSKDSSLNPLGGTDNGASLQYYRYDDRDRSLICVSCPPPGETPSAEVDQLAVQPALDARYQRAPNMVPLADDGDFVFATPTPLVDADQNSPKTGGEPVLGTDIYEWRDGRLLLVTDGLTNWPHRNSIPKVNGVTPSGRDVFIAAAAQYTPDALDSYFRLYDARIGGGFEFPPPPKPCPLEVCQGTPKGAPEEAAPGTGAFSGLGNLHATTRSRKPCPKGKHRSQRGGKARCVKPKRKATKKKKQRANHERRNGR